jgi:hypothetical protein
LPSLLAGFPSMRPMRSTASVDGGPVSNPAAGANIVDLLFPSRFRARPHPSTRRDTCRFSRRRSEAKLGSRRGSAR